VHHLGVRVDEIRFSPRHWSQHETLRVLIAASFREKKGIPDALEAVAQLRREVPLEVTLVGDAGPDASSEREKRRIMDTITRLNLEPVVRLLGYQRRAVLHDHAYAHHVFLSPSVTAASGDTEGGIPVGIIEMAATGMPVVSTRHCDIPEVLGAGQGHLLAEEHDVPGLVDRLRWLTAHPDGWTGPATATRRHIEAEYDAKAQGPRLARIYREVLA
jgi:colanic acid/amylovoran biosynthesis glycosyltransferase